MVKRNLSKFFFEYENISPVCSVEQEAKEPDVYNIAMLQRQCDDFKHMDNYLESKIVPEDKKWRTW